MWNHHSKLMHQCPFPLTTTAVACLTWITFKCLLVSVHVSLLCFRWASWSALALLCPGRPMCSSVSGPCFTPRAKTAWRPLSACYPASSQNAQRCTTLLSTTFSANLSAESYGRSGCVVTKAVVMLWAKWQEENAQRKIAGHKRQQKSESTIVEVTTKNI